MKHLPVLRSTRSRRTRTSRSSACRRRSKACRTRSTTGRCCSPACSSSGARRARPRSSRSAPGPSARSPGSRTSTASRWRRRRRTRSTRSRCCACCSPARPPGGTPNRRACEAVLRHVWRGGADAERCRHGSPRCARSSRRARSDAAKRSSSALQGRDRRGARTRRVRRADDRSRRPPVLGPRRAVDAARAYLRGDPWFDGPAGTRRQRAPGVGAADAAAASRLDQRSAAACAHCQRRFSSASVPVGFASEQGQSCRGQCRRLARVASDPQEETTWKTIWPDASPTNPKYQELKAKRTASAGGSRWR